MLRTSVDKIQENGFRLTKERSRRYTAKTITDANYAVDIALLVNVPAQSKTLLYRLAQAAAGIGLHINAHKTEYMCFNHTGDISTLNGWALKLVDKLTYLGSSVSSTETDIDLTDEMERSFFQAAVVSIQLYGCTTWTLTRRMEKKLDVNYTKMLRVILNKSWRHHPTTVRPPTTRQKTIKIRRTRDAGHCWGSRDELVSDVLLWTLQQGRAKAGRPALTYIQRCCADTECSPEDHPKAMDDKEVWRERVRNIRPDSTPCWWWWNRTVFMHKNGFGIK